MKRVDDVIDLKVRPMMFMITLNINIHTLLFRKAI